MNPPTRNNAGALLSGLAVLRDQPALFGPVASTATAWRVLERAASDPDGLARLRAARAHARGRACAAGGDPDVEVLIIDADATLVLAQTDAKEGAAGTYKGSFGFAPLLAYLDRGQAPPSRHRGADDRGAVGGLLRLEVWGGGVAGGVRQGPDRGLGLLVPVRGQECEPPGLLASLVCIDLVDVGGGGATAPADRDRSVGRRADLGAAPRRSQDSEAVSWAGPRDRESSRTEPQLLGP
jgi:hypothetical protein